MELVVQKVLATGLIVLLSLSFGFLPLLLARRYDFSSIDTLDPVMLKREKKKMKNVILSFLLNLGGGVLIANCFCHWLPEVREGLEHKSIDSFLPLAEVIMCSGFFFICGLEELLHHFLHPHQTAESKVKKEMMKETGFSTNNGDQNGVAHRNEEEEEKETEKTASQVKAAIRTVFVVFALSFHSMIEGLALSLEGEAAGVWLNTGATALHKFVISFSVGVELISNKLSLCTYSLSIVVFSLAPALGSTVGIATGTIVYVVFFEIIPKAKAVGGTGKQHILARILGFAIFLPSLYFHQDHEEGGDTSCTNSSAVLQH